MAVHVNRVLVRTDKAVRVLQGKCVTWLPKSQIHSPLPEGTDGADLVVSDWIAIQKGLVFSRN